MLRSLSWMAYYRICLDNVDSRSLFMPSLLYDAALPEVGLPTDADKTAAKATCMNCVA